MLSTTPSTTWISATNWRIYFDDEKRFVVESWESIKDQASSKRNSMGPKSYSNNLHDEFTRKIYYPISIEAEKSESGKILFLTFKISDTKVVMCDPKRKYRHKKFPVQTSNEIKELVEFVTERGLH